MRLMDLIKNNNSKSNIRSLNTEVLEIEYSKRNRWLFSFWVRSFETYSSPTGHIATILIKTKKGQMLNSDVKLHCTCPAYLYWGSQYHATQQGYAYKYKEKRAPNIRDPQGKNLICKHIASLRKSLRRLTVSKAHKKFVRASILDFSQPTGTIPLDNPELTKIIAEKFNIPENLVYLQFEDKLLELLGERENELYTI